LASNGSYSVKAVKGSCEASMLTSVSITVKPMPQSFLLSSSAGFNLCPYQTTTLGLSGSENNTVSYALYRNSSAELIETKTGVSGPLNFLPVSQAGSYYVVATKNGCSNNTNGVPISVYPLPAMPTFGEVRQFCGFAKVKKGVLDPTWFWQTSADPNTFTEANNADELTVTQNGPIYLAAKSANGCWSVSSMNITLDNAQPTITLTASQSNLCQYSTTVLTASGGQYYTWKDDVGNVLDLPTSQSTYTTPPITVTSTFTVTGYSATGCFQTQSVTIALVPPETLVPARPVLAKVSTTEYQVSMNNVQGSPANYNYYWQTSPEGEQTTAFAEPRLANGGVYYLRAKKSNGCWGPAISVEVPDLTPPVYDAALTNGNVSYVRTYAFKDKNLPNTDPDLMTEDQVLVSTAYLDGLGRAVQQVSKRGSPDKKDLVAAMDYDIFGRDNRKFLPYVSITNSGDVQGQPFTSQKSFYQTATDVAHSDLAFSYAQFENSPLNRQTAQTAPGETWVGGTGLATAKDIRSEYAVNTTAELIKKFDIVIDAVDNSKDYLKLLGTYTEGDLARTVTKDEHQKQIIEYTNKSGQTVLKRVEAPNSEWADTYYVYDRFGQLRFTIPPEGIKAMSEDPASHLSGMGGVTILSSNNTFSGPTAGAYVFLPGVVVNTNPSFAAQNGFSLRSYQGIIENLSAWIYEYRYDSRKRMTAKRVPGADWVYSIYDKRDRLVMTQDGNQRANGKNEWTYTKYDALNRPVMTGIYTHAGTEKTQLQMQVYVDGLYNTYNSTYFETYDGNTGNHGYTNNQFPKVNTSVLSVSYFDDYSLKTLISDAQYNYVNNDFANQPATENLEVKGQATGSKVRILGQPTFLWSVVYYDYKYRPIQTVRANHKGGVDRETQTFDFTGKVLEKKINHARVHEVVWTNPRNVSTTDNQVVKLTGTTTYDAGASSLQVLGAGKNGWIEVAVANTSRVWMFGFNNSDGGAAIAEIDYALNLNGGNLTVFESNTSRGVVATGIALGDVLRVERTGTTITYQRNGMVVYTSTVPSSAALVADLSIQTLNGPFADARASFGALGNVKDNEALAVNRRYEYDHAHRLKNIYHKINSLPEVLLVSNTYNQIGELIKKKVHSQDGGTTFAQAVDYRYTIRGWLSQINDPNLALTNAGEPLDYFGMQLAYDENLGTGNTGLFNGNISGMKWSQNTNDGTLLQRSYNYSYDAMNRVTGAAYQEWNGTVWANATDKFSEANYQYDLNGNILRLSRKGAAGDLMDDLTYYYGQGLMRSNKLLRVTDAGNAQGFADGNTTGDDYTYDANGSMVGDRNKALYTTPIAYNYLNLPEKITKDNGEQVQYLYDATGRKLSQTVYNSTGARTKRSDYVGEFFYEGGLLKFVNHEEGRVLLGYGPNLLANADASTLSGFNASGTVALSNVTLNNETYVKAVCNQTTGNPGVWPIGGTINVTAGERYTFSLKGYRDANRASLYVWFNNSITLWPAVDVPTTEGTVNIDVTVPAGAVQMRVGVQWVTPATGQALYINSVSLNRYGLESQNLIANAEANNLTSYSAIGAATLATTTTNGDNFVRATCNTATGTPGMYLSGDVGVKAGERYVYKVRGLRTATSNAYLYVTSAQGDIVWNTNLVGTTDTWTAQEFTVPAGVTQVKVGVKWSNPVSGQTVSVSQVSLTRLEAEYQYTLKDHLGNVRVTYTTRSEQKEYLATLEDSNATQEQADFGNYASATRQNSTIYNRTNGGTRSQRLSASNTEIIGLAKSLKVKPGEKVNLEVWGKYFTPTATNSSVVTNIAGAITSAFGVSPASTGEGASAYQALNALFATGPVIGAGQWENAGAPKAYLNYILFDQNYVAYDMGWDQINASAEATVANPNPPHDYMALTANVTKAGYLYVYLSNESAQITDVFFDDLRITHVQNAGVIQAENYYAFGSTFDSYIRDNSLKNDYKLNGKEDQDELNLGLVDFKSRMYDPVIGRWSSVDPMADLMKSYSPYSFVYNSPVLYIDPNGMKPKWNGQSGSSTGYYDDENGESLTWDEVQNYIKKEGGPNGKRNLMIILNSPQQFLAMASAKNNENWHFYNADNLEDAISYTESYTKSVGKLNHLVVRSHGGTCSMALGLAEDGAADRGTAETFFNRDDGNTIITNIKRPADGLTPINETDQLSLRALLTFAKSMAKNGSLIFTACKAGGVDGDFGVVLNKLFKASGVDVNFDMYFNGDPSIRYTRYNNGELKILDLPLTAVSDYKNGWVKISPDGLATPVGGTLQLNGSGKPFIRIKPSDLKVK
jgi:RHS repeat-associated protein